MSFKKIKTYLIAALFLYLICFSVFFYLHPVQNLTDWEWYPGLNADMLYYHEAASNFLNGKDMYAGRYSNPPFFAIMLSLLLYLPQKAQVSAWVGLNLLCAALLCYFYVTCFSGGLKKRIAVPIALFTIACSIPVLDSFKWGQQSFMVFFFVIVSYVGFVKLKFRLAGFFLAAAAAVKVFPAAFLFFYILFWERGGKKVVKWFTISAVVLFLLVPLFSIGYEQTFEGFRRSINPSGPQEVVPIGFGQEIRSILCRYFSNDYALFSRELLDKKLFPCVCPPPDFLPFIPLITSNGANMVGLMISILIFLLLLCFLYKKRKKQDLYKHMDLYFSFFTAVFMVSITYAWLHYYVFLSFPYYIMFVYFVKQNDKHYQLPFLMFILSFVVMNGNMFIVKSTCLFEFLGYLGIYFWMSVLLASAIVIYSLRKEQVVSQKQVSGL